MWISRSIYILTVTLLLISEVHSKKCTTIEVATLKRGFHPGQLYDARHEQLVAGLAPWNSSQTSRAQLLKRNAQDVDLTYSSASSTSERAELLDVSAELRLEMEMMDVSGSAGYVKDTQDTEYEETFAAIFKSVTHSLELKPELLNSITYPEALSTTSATHVVTKVTYGASAIFNFKKETTSKVDTKKITGDLSLKITLGPVIISGAGSIDFNENEKNEYQSVECSFYGDMKLPAVPRNALEAMDILQTLNDRVTEDSAVDVKALLLPIECLPGQTNRLIVHKIKKALFKRVMRRVDDFEYLMRKLNDLDRTHLVQSFAGVKNMITNYRRHCSTVQTDFMGQLAVLIPEVRGTGQAEKKLGDLLEQYPDITNRDQFKFDKSRTTENVIWKAYPLIQQLLVTADKLLVEKMKTSRSNGVLIVLNLDLRQLSDCNDFCTKDDRYNLAMCGSCLRNMSATWSNDAFMGDLLSVVQEFQLLQQWNQNDTKVKFAVSEKLQWNSRDAPAVSISAWQGFAEWNNDVHILEIKNIRTVAKGECSDSQIMEWDTSDLDLQGGELWFQVQTGSRPDIKTYRSKEKSVRVNSIAGSVSIGATCTMSTSRRAIKPHFKCGYQKSTVSSTDCPVWNGEP